MKQQTHSFNTHGLPPSLPSQLLQKEPYIPSRPPTLQPLLTTPHTHSSITSIGTFLNSSLLPGILDKEYMLRAKRKMNPMSAES
jgi:hypothetical protein